MSLLTDDIDPWIRVDLLQPTLVSGVITQGRGPDVDDHTHDRQQWVNSFHVNYGNVSNALQPITDLQNNPVVT